MLCLVRPLEGPLGAYSLYSKLQVPPFPTQSVQMWTSIKGRIVGVQKPKPTRQENIDRMKRDLKEKEANYEVMLKHHGKLSLRATEHANANNRRSLKLITEQIINLEGRMKSEKATLKVLRNQYSMVQRAQHHLETKDSVSTANDIMSSFKADLSPDEMATLFDNAQDHQQDGQEIDDMIKSETQNFSNYGTGGSALEDSESDDEITKRMDEIMLRSVEARLDSATPNTPLPPHPLPQTTLPALPRTQYVAPERPPVVSPAPAPAPAISPEEAELRMLEESMAT